MAEPTGTIEPIPLYDRKDLSLLGGLGEMFSNYINQPLNTEDPLQNLVSGLSQNVSKYDFAMGGGTKLASGFLVARETAIKEIKKLQAAARRQREIIDRSTDPNELQGATTKLASIEKQLKFKVDKQALADKKNSVADATSKTGQTLFHGSSKTGIKSLEIPKQIFDKTGREIITKNSTGGIYSVADPSDPRFKSFSKGFASKGGGDKGSGYVLKADFKKPLDIDDMPDDMLDVLKNMEQYRGRPSRGGNTKIDFDINTVLRGSNYNQSKTPMGIDKEFADIFKTRGYDALKFPKRNMGGESETFVSLDPSNLKITDEIPYDQLDDFIRTLLNDL
tara:strand:+ start:42 stop:1046 length:1005 start_codon:yes stop_codon:yes gene_type:complete